MVAVFTGTGLGLFNTSMTQLGGASWGSGGLGQLRGGQSVNLSTGNLVLQELDESLLVRGLSATLLRTYNSRGTVTGQGQDGWVTGFERNVTLSGTLNNAGSTVSLTTGDGQTLVFTYSGTANKYVTTGGDGAHDSITWNGTAKQWTYVEGSTRREELYADHASATLKGRLLRIRDLKSDGTTPAQYDIVYNPSHQILEVRSIDGSGATADAIVFAYNAAGQLSSISTRENGSATLRTQVSYGYENLDGSGRLSWVQTDLTPEITSDNGWDDATASNNDGKRFRTSYTYVSGSASDLRIASVSTSDGVTVAYTYEADGSGGYRVKTVTQGSAVDGSTQTTSFTYNAGSTDVVDGAGRTWTYEYDASKQLTGVLSPAVNGLRQKTSYTYDTSGNLTRMTQAPSAGGAAALDTVFKYDTNGNRILQRDLQGNTIEWTYDATTQQLKTEKRYTVADADGLDPTHAGNTHLPSGALTSNYIYDSRARLRFLVNAAGEVTEFTYATSGNGIGQIASERRYLGATYTGTYDETSLNSWATNATSKRKSSSALTTYSYDAKGRLSQSAQYATVSADVNGTGVLDTATGLTNFSYDAQGLLRQKIAVHGASRSLAGVAPTSSEVTDYLYDGMGRLLSVLTRDIATTAMPDPRIDPTGYAAWVIANDATTVLSTYAYVDSANQIKLTTDTGVVRTEARNRAGLLLSSSEAGMVSGATVTRTTQFYYDTTGRLRASEDAAGARSYVFYDNAGRPVATVDGTGAVVQTVYDGIGRVVQHVAYATRVDTSTWLSSGAVTKTELVFAATAPTLTAGQAWVQTSTANDRTTSLAYDSAGRLSTETVVGADASQTRKTTYTYDAASRLLQTTVSDGADTAATARTARSLYDAADRQIATIDASNHVTETVYDAGGRVVKTIRYANASGSPAATTLAALRPSTSSKDQITRYFYDGRGNQTGVLESIGDANTEGYLTEYVYDEASNQRAVKAYAKKLTGLTGSETLATLRTSATTGAPTEVFRLTQRTFNALGQLITEQNHEGTVTRYTYDEAGRLVKTEAAQGSSEVREGNLRFDVFGQLIGELTGEGSTHLIGGMSESQLDALYAQYGTRHSYDLLGRRIESIDAAGNQTWIFYDAQGRPTFVVRGVHDSGNVPNAQGEVTETRYDAFGQVIDSIAYTGRITLGVPGSRASAQSAIATLGAIGASDSRTQYAYDRRGLLIQRTDAEGYRSTYAYNAFGEMATQQDWELDNSLRRTVTSTWDKRGLLTNVAEAGGSLNRSQGTTYDAFGRVLTRTDARGIVSTASYDRMGRQIGQSTDLGSGRIESGSTSYDAYSRVVTQTDAVGKVTTYSYSDTTRTMTVTSPEGVVVTTAYDRLGQTLTVSQLLPGGTTVVSSFSYDRDGHVTAQTDALGRTTTHTYDARQLLTTTTDASGRKIEYRYDALGRTLQRIEDPGAGKLNLTTTTVYDGQGRQITVTDASGRVTAMVYDRKGNLTETTRDPNGLALKTTYSWDRDGRQLTVTEGAGSATATTTAYGYDALGRRISETRGSGVLNLTTVYEYDANDNVTRSIDASGRSTRYSYDGANRMRFSIDGADGVTEVTYDLAGRATMTRAYVRVLDASTLGVAPTEAQVAGLVASQTLANDALDEVSYRLYDGDGRVRLIVDGTGGVSETVYDVAGRVVRQTRYAQSATLTPTLRNALVAGTATVASVGAVASASDESVRYVYDAAGQTRFKVDTLGNTTQFEYDAAGRVVSDHRYIAPIGLTPALLAKLDAGTATATDIANAAATNATTPPWSTGFESTTPAGLDVSLLDPLNNGGATIQNGRLAFNRVPTAAVTYPQVWSQNTYSLSQTLTLRGEISTDASLQGSTMLFALNGNAAGGLQREGVYLVNGELHKYEVASGSYTAGGSDLLGTLAANTTYVVEFEIGATATTTYVYVKGQGRASGYSFSRALTASNFGDYRLLMHGINEPGGTGASLYVDNLAILNTAAAVSTSYRYDAAGRLAATVDGLGNTETYTYDAAGRRLSTTDANGHTSRSIYDAAGRVVYSIDATGGYMRTWYDSVDRVTARRQFATMATTPAPSDTTTVAQMDAQLVFAAADIGTVYTVYDSAGRLRYTVRMTTGSSMSVTDSSYDGAGRLLQQRGYSALMALDSALSTKLVNGTATDADFAAFVSANASTAQSARTVYDAAGRATYSIDATGAFTRNWYDAIGRVVAVRKFAAVFPAGVLNDSATTAQLDAQLGPVGAWSAAYQHEYRVYDAAGRLRISYDAFAQVTQTDYDGAGRMIITRRYAVPFSSTDPNLGSKLFAGTASTADFATFTAANESTARAQAMVYDAAGQLRYTLARHAGVWTVGERQYDGVGRTTAEVRYGVTIAYTPGQTEAQVIGALQTALIPDPTQARTTRFAYDAANRQRFVMDATGALSEQRYDGAGRVVETRSYGNLPVGIAVTTAALSAWGQGQASADVRKVTNSYDGAGQLVARTDALGHSETFTYDGAGRMLTRTDRTGAVWSYEYDNAGRRTAEISPASDVYGITALGALSVSTRSIVTRYVYDGLGQVTRKTEDADNATVAERRITDYVYDTRGHLIRTILPNPGAIDPVTGNLVFNGANPTIETTFDALGQAVVQKDARGYYRYTTYDAQGQVSAEVDQAGNVTTYGYNAYGEQTQLLRYAAALNTNAVAFTSVSWQAGQAMVWSQIVAGVDNSNGFNRAITTAYDGLGRKTQVTSTAVQYYNAAGTWVWGTPTTQFVYNAYGDAVKESVLLEGTAGQGDAVWAHTWRYFDAAGRTTTTVDAEGHVTALTWSATGEVVKSVEYARAIATASLNTQTPPTLPGAGDLATGDDRETRWSYDVLGRKASETVVRNYRNTDGSSAQHDYVTAYGYDFEDRVTTITDNTGTITTTYNALGQSVAVREQARSVVVANADALLQANSATDLTSASLIQQRSPYTTIAYDGLGRMIATRRHANGHDGVNPPAINAADQVDLTFYDQLDRVLMTQTAAAWASTTPTAHRTWSEYDAAGNLTHSWSYLDAADSSRNAMVHRWYSYDAVGRQTGASQTRTAIATGATSTDQSEAVSYNAFGEIVAKTYGGLAGTLSYSYDAAGRMIADNATGATRNFGYNLAGHQVRESHMTWIDSTTGAVETVTRTQTDKLGRAIAITLPSHTTTAGVTSLVRQKYDRWGNTVQVIDARGYQTDYVYNDHNQLIRETRPLVWVVGENGAGSWQRPVNEWYYGAAGRLRGTRDANGNLRTYEYDAVGHQVSSTDALGNVTRMAFDVFGNQRLAQDALGHITFQDYDLLNRVSTIGDYLPNGATRQRAVLQSYVLNQHGDRVRVTNALNFTAKYDYDGQQRLLRSETAMGVVTNTAYDVQGHKILETNALSELTPSYDDRDAGALVRLNAMSWQYDVFGRVIDHNNLSGRDSDYTYDAQSGMLTGESASGGANAGYTDATKTIKYTRNGRVREIVETNGGTYRYEYDAAGNRTLEESDVTDSYGVRMHTITRSTYDSNNRLQRVVQDEVDAAGATTKRIFDLAYDYDANGNRRRVVTQSGYGPNVTGIGIANNAPPAVATAPADRTFRTGTSGEFRLLFSDVFRDAENDALSLTIAQDGGAALPSWLVATRDPQTGEIVFTGTVPAGASNADVVVRLTAFETASPSKQATTTFVVRVRSNTIPAATAASTTFNAVVGKSFGKTLAASTYFIDPDVGDTLGLSVVGTVPAWLTVDTSKPGVASLIGTPPSAGSYTLTLRATDAQGATFDRTITVNAATNAAPTVVAAPAMAIAKIGRPFAWSKPLSQVFADANSDTLQVSAVGMPPWLVFQSLGGATPELRFDAQVPLDEVDNRIYTITLTATDPSGASISTTLQVKVVVNVAPVAPASITLPVIKQNLAYSAVVPAFTDANGDMLTYNVSTMPTGLVFDGETRTISGTPTAAGSWTIWYSAFDGIAWTSTSFTMVVQANTAPVAPTVGNQNVTPGTTVNLTLPAFTDANGDALTYSAGNLPTGLSFNPTTRAITGAASTAGNWAVTYQADDGRGGVTSIAFVFTVAVAGQNQPPVVAYALVDQTAIGGEAFSYTAPANTFVDPEGQTLTYTAAKSDGAALPSWLSFNAATRTFSGTPPLLGSFSWTLRVRATDPQGLYVDASFVLTKEEGGAGGQFAAQGATFEMGAMSQTSLLAGGGMMTAASLVSVQTKDQWFTYDGENRLKVVNGALVNGAIEVVASTATYNADSYSVQYDGAGHATAHVLRKTENSVTQTLVTLSTYDLRGNRRYEFHTQVLGGGFAGIAKEFIVDAAGQTTGTRSYFANGTIKQTLVYQGGQEPEVPEDIDVSGWLSDAETMQYDDDGRALMQAVYKRGLQGRENIQAEGNQYADIALLRLQNRVDYTHSDGSNAWTDTDLSNNASGYDAAGRLTTYRYSARNPNGPDWYTHTFTSTYEGWESWQEKTVAGASTNSTFKPTTNTLHLDAYGRILKQQEHTVGASLDDRVRVYTYSGDGMVQTRREGTVNGSNVFTQSTKAPNDTPLNYQFVYAAGQQLAELQAGGEVRTSKPQTNTLSKIVGGSGPYTAGGGMATVLEGETLQSLAQRVYGTSTLWYVLADANGLSDATAPLTAGVQLKTPSVGVNSNDANTFKPYNPNEAIGNTTPGLPYITPPPKDKCGALTMLIQVVVTIVVGYYAGPVAGAAAGDAAGQFSAAALNGRFDWGAFFRGVTNPENIAKSILVNSSPLLQAAAIFSGKDKYRSLVNPLDYGMDYDYKRTATAALTAYVGGGVSGSIGGVGGAMAGAAASYATNYALNKAFDRPASFSMRSLFASVAAAGITASVFGTSARDAAQGSNSPWGRGAFGPSQATRMDFNWKEVAQHAFMNMAKGAIDYGIRKAFKAPDTHWNTGEFLVNALGDTIGSMATGQIRPQVDAIKRKYAKPVSKEEYDRQLDALIAKLRQQAIDSGASQEVLDSLPQSAEHFRSQLTEEARALKSKAAEQQFAGELWWKNHNGIQYFGGGMDPGLKAPGPYGLSGDDAFWQWSDKPGTGWGLKPSQDALNDLKNMGWGDRLSLLGGAFVGLFGNIGTDAVDTAKLLFEVNQFTYEGMAELVAVKFMESTGQTSSKRYYRTRDSLDKKFETLTNIATNTPRVLGELPATILDDIQSDFRDYVRSVENRDYFAVGAGAMQLAYKTLGLFAAGYGVVKAGVAGVRYGKKALNGLSDFIKSIPNEINTDMPPAVQKGGQRPPSYYDDWNNNTLLEEEKFMELWYDTDKGKYTPGAIEEMRAAQAAQRQGLLPEGELARGMRGADLNVGGLDVSIKAYRGNELLDNPRKLQSLVGTLKADRDMSLLLDSRSLKAGQVDRIIDLLTQHGIDASRILVPNLNYYRPIRVIGPDGKITQH